MPVRGEAERWPGAQENRGAGATRMANGGAGSAAGDGGTGRARLPEAAGVVIFRRAGDDVEFLLLQNARRGEWAPPKGHLELSDGSAEVAALRELHEETGIVLSAADLDTRSPSSLGMVTTYALPKPTRKCPTGVKETHYYLAEVSFALYPPPHTLDPTPFPLHPSPYTLSPKP